MLTLSGVFCYANAKSRKLINPFMKIHKLLLLLCSHSIVGIMGFALGIYALPILTAPHAPSASEVTRLSQEPLYTATFKKDLKGSDFLHWGDGTVSLSENRITLMGNLSPGPDFMLYLSPKFVETEAEFEQVKSTMKLIGEVRTFDNFVVEVSNDVNLDQYNTVIVWCKSFGEFITSAKYR